MRALPWAGLARPVGAEIDHIYRDRNRKTHIQCKNSSICKLTADTVRLRSSSPSRDDDPSSLLRRYPLQSSASSSTNRTGRTCARSCRVLGSRFQTRANPRAVRCGSNSATRSPLFNTTSNNTFSRLEKTSFICDFSAVEAPIFTRSKWLRYWASANGPRARLPPRLLEVHAWSSSHLQTVRE